MSRFDGKVALVTGGGSGIGAATAAALAREGARVGVFDVDGGAARATVVGIEGAGGRALALAGDTRDEQAVKHAVDATVVELGGLDLLAAIAGVLHIAPVEELTAEAWDRVLETNAKGSFLFVKHSVPELRNRGGGAIVTAGSVMGLMSTAGAAAYSASKGAVMAMTSALAVELGPHGIRVNSVVPGVVRTPMVMDLVEDPQALAADLARVQPIRDVIEAEDVARLVLFLLSDEARAITGSCHRVDAGLISHLPE
jgi:NAD(P)-dependent dehydrogenase (short-subunit alcohol dehydrogenase family)